MVLNQPAKTVIPSTSVKTLQNDTVKLLINPFQLKHLYCPVDLPQ